MNSSKKCAVRGLLGSVVLLFVIANFALAQDLEKEFKTLSELPLQQHKYLEDNFNKKFEPAEKPKGYKGLKASVETPKICNKTEKKVFCDFGKVGFGTLKIYNGRDEKKLIVKLGERASGNEVWFPNEKTTDIKNIEYFETNLVVSAKESKIIDPPLRYRPNKDELPAGINSVIPFRYVEIKGVDNLDGIEIERLNVHYPYNSEKSFFSSSNTDLNVLWDLSKNTLLETTYTGLFVDGNRERKPYEADAYINQKGYGTVEGSPEIARYTIDFLNKNPTWPTEWLLLFISMVYEDYMQTGDVATIKKNYAAMKLRLLNDLVDENGFITTKDKAKNNQLIKKINSKQGIIADVVDWPPNERDGYETHSVINTDTVELKMNSGTIQKIKQRETKALLADINGYPAAAKYYRNEIEVIKRTMYEMPKYNTVVNMYRYDALIKMAKLSKAIDNDEYKAYNAQAAALKDKINENMFDSTRKVYVDGVGANHASLHANMFALEFGLVEDKYKKDVMSYIKKKGMRCSVYCASFLLNALYRNGEGGYATSLLLNKTDRGWLNMINRHDATLTFESWNEEINPEMDLNHAWGASPANIILNGMLGVNPTRPGWVEYEMRPWIKQYSKIAIKFPMNGTEGTLEIAENGKIIKVEVYVPKNRTAKFYSEYLDTKIDLVINDEPLKLGKIEDPINLKSGRYVMYFTKNEH